MKLNASPRVSLNDPLLQRELRDHAYQVNAVSEGRISAAYNALTAAPTTGTYAQGDFVKNSAPTVDGDGSILTGWMCVAGGSPGTLVEVRTPAAGGGGWTYVFLETAAVNSTTTNTNTALAFTPLANKRYEIEVRLYMQSAATTTGVRFGVRWPTAGVAQNAAWMISPSNATAGTFRFWGNTAVANVAATGVAVANEGIWGGGFAMMVTNGSIAGDFIITLASEIAASEARLMANSFIRYREI